MQFSKRVFIIVVLFGLVYLSGLPALGQASSSAAGVANKIYDIWVSQGFASIPFEPFLDCAIFTKTQLCIARCGDCGPFSEIELGVTLWKARVPCDGLNLVFTGTARNGPETSVIAATVVGRTEQTNFAVEGVRDETCAVDLARTGVNPYQKP
jgi:hypothetical protein